MLPPSPGGFHTDFLLWKVYSKHPHAGTDDTFKRFPVESGNGLSAAVATVANRSGPGMATVIALRGIPATGPVREQIMKALADDPLVWPPVEKLAVLLNAVSRIQQKILNALGTDAPLDNPLACSFTAPFVESDATVLSDAFDRPASDVAAILNDAAFGQWLESRGVGNGREMVARIRLLLNQADTLIGAFRDSGQLDDADEETERRGRFEDHSPGLTEAYKALSRQFKNSTMGGKVSVKAASEFLERLGGIAADLASLAPNATERSSSCEIASGGNNAEWQFDDHKNEVTFKGVTFPLQGRPCDVLKILARSISPITTDDIGKALGDTHPISSAVNSYISQLKETLLRFFDLSADEKGNSELCAISHRDRKTYRSLRSDALTPKTSTTQLAATKKPASKKL